MGGRGINRNFIRKVCTKIPTVGKEASEKTREKRVIKRRNLSGTKFFPLYQIFLPWRDQESRGASENLLTKLLRALFSHMIPGGICTPGPLGWEAPEESRAWGNRSGSRRPTSASLWHFLHMRNVSLQFIGPSAYLNHLILAQHELLFTSFP